MQNQSQTIAGSHTLHSIQVQKEVVTDGGVDENRSLDAKYAGDDVYGHKAV
jgi:hypothetical protein